LLLARHALQILLNQCACLFGPGLDLLMAPCTQVVHVLKQLWPGEDTWSGIWSHEIRAACAKRVSTKFFAHVLTHTCQFVLNLCAHNSVRCLARFHLHKSGRLRVPAFDCFTTPLNQVVHVVKQLIPSRHTRRGIWGHESWACALGIGTHFFAHVFTDSCELVLEGSTVLLRLLLARHALQILLNQCACLFGPGLDLLMAPCTQVVHVLKQLWPGEDTWSGIWSHEIRAACAKRVSTKFFAHVLTHTCQFVLNLCAHNSVRCLARFHLHKSGRLRVPAFDCFTTPLNQVVHVVEQLIPSRHTRRSIGGHKSWACALGIGTHFFAHVLTDSCNLVLDSSTIFQFLLFTRCLI